MKPLIIANWKMRMLPIEQQRLAHSIVRAVGSASDTHTLAIAPTLESLALVGETLKKTPIALCAQDCFWEERGAYTGEVSPWALKALGCRFVLIGHSERRVYLAESDEMIAHKIASAFTVPGLQPVLCIGEGQPARRDGSYLAFLKGQLAAALKRVPKAVPLRLVIAYEPLWAISTAAELTGSKGRSITPEDCAEVYRFLKKMLARTYPHISASILYGGSVDASNVVSFVQPGVSDGALVGGASIHLTQMKKIIHLFRQ